MKSPGILDPRTPDPQTRDPHGPPARDLESERSLNDGQRLRPAPESASKYPQLDVTEGQRGNKYWWIWLLGFCLIGYGCYRLYYFANAKKEQAATRRGAMMRPRSITVATARAHTGDMPIYLSGLGTVTAFNTVTVKARIDGQLVSVNFREGQFVKAGDILGQVDPRPYQVALESANSSLAQAKGNLAKDQAALRDAQVNVERYQELFRSNIIARQQLDTQQATADQFKGSIAADQAAIATAEAAINSAKLNLTYTNIVAPIGGRIGLRLVDVGNIVHAADATGLAVITQLQPISVLFSIPEEQLPPVLDKLRGGAKLKTEAYDRDGRRKIADGTLLTVDNQIDATTGTSRLKAVFDNKDSNLFPNQFVNVRLALDTRRGAIIVPTVAVQRGPTGTFVYAVNDESVVSVKPVKLGITEGNDVSILEGLAPGDQVVIDGAEKLMDGMTVTVAKSAGGSGLNSRRGN